MTWRTIDTVSAEIVPIGGGESFDQDRVIARLRHRITLRYRKDVTPRMRFRSGGRIFDILAVRNIDERGQWLVCECEEDDA